MKMLLTAAQTLPLYVGRAGERAPPLCGAVAADAGHVARAGDAVAALVRVSDKEENWILAEVIDCLDSICLKVIILSKCISIVKTDGKKYSIKYIN